MTLSWRLKLPDPDQRGCPGFISIQFHGIMQQAVGLRGTVHCRAVIPSFTSSLMWVLTLQEEDTLRCTTFPKSLRMISDSGWQGFPGSIIAASSTVIAFLSLSFELLILTLFLIILHYFTICIKFVLSPYLNLVVLLSFSLRGEKGAPLPCCAWSCIIPL